MPPASLVVGPDTTWVATDTFDRREYQLGVVHSAASYLLGPTESTAGSDGPPGQWTDRQVAGHQTVSGYVGGTSVTASSYGFDLVQSPELAPFNAVDEATFTAWQARNDPVTGSEGAWLRLDAGRPVSVGEISVWLFAETTRRPVAGAIRVTTEAGSVLNDVDRTEDEQRLRVPEGPTRWFELTLVDVGGAKVDPVLGAGIREVQVPGVRFQRYTQVPTDVAALFTGAGAGSVTYSFDRERVDPSTPFGGDEEPCTVRRAATFELGGGAEMAAFMRKVGERYSDFRAEVMQLAAPGGFGEKRGNSTSGVLPIRSRSELAIMFLAFPACRWSAS